MVQDSDKPFLPSWARYVILPGLFGPVLILGFIFVTEFAHNEGRCPYEAGETRALTPEVSVREDHRNCLWDVEDHRYSVVRSGSERVLGNRRFRAPAFDPGNYSWSAEIDSKDQVHVLIKNDGHADAQFREGTEKERAAD
jgi:hypothetical protein